MESVKEFQSVLLDVIKQLVDHPEKVTTWLEPTKDGQGTVVTFDTKGQNRFIAGKQGKLSESLINIVKAWSGKNQHTLMLVFTEDEGGLSYGENSNHG